MAIRRRHVCSATRGGLLLALLALPGCLAYSHSERDLDRTPIVNIGSRASIIYPGQSVPFPGSPTAPAPNPATAPPGSVPPGPGAAGNGTAGAPVDTRESATPPPPAPEAQQYVQAPSDPDAGMVFLGGAREDITKHSDIREDPLLVKYLTAPLALVAAPFVLAKEAIQGEPEPGPALPRPPTPTAPVTQNPVPQVTQAERRMNDMSRELAERRSRQQRSMREQALEPGTPVVTAALDGAAPSIADELAALRQGPTTPAPMPDATPRATGSANPTRTPDSPEPPAPRIRQEASVADGIVDRNGDGKIDQWIYRDRGEIVREELDEDFDGRVDRIIHTDLESHDVNLVEEDNRGDGLVDTWTDYRNGAIARRRADSDGDGAVDTWSFYRDGNLVRHEQDTNHDGFRDAVTFYRDGRRARETRDLDADGDAEIELFYDANDQVSRREEDTDGDGLAEVVSHYENGRLVRRELLSVPELAAQKAGDTQKQ